MAPFWNLDQYLTQLCQVKGQFLAIFREILKFQRQKWWKYKRYRHETFTGVFLWQYSTCWHAFCNICFVIVAAYHLGNRKVTCAARRRLLPVGRYGLGEFTIACFTMKIMPTVSNGHKNQIQEPKKPLYAWKSHTGTSTKATDLTLTLNDFGGQGTFWTCYFSFIMASNDLS